MKRYPGQKIFLHGLAFMKIAFSSFGRVILDFILPSSCQVCGEYSSFTTSWPVCQVCLDTMQRIPAGCSRCGRPHWDENIRSLAPNFLCGDCLDEKKPLIDEIRSALIYQGAAKKLICLFKYKNRTRLLKIFSPFIRETLSRWDRISNCDYIVPVPLHMKKHRQRTFNPSLLLADIIAMDFGIPVRDNVLIRSVPGTVQAGLSRKERIKAVKGVFAVRKDKVMAGKRVLLVDDVLTTGATARECAKILKKAGVKTVYVFSLLTAPH
jgi:ComF family protein